MKPPRHSWPSLLAALLAGAVLGGFGPSFRNAADGGYVLPDSGKSSATANSTGPVAGNAADRGLKGTARVSDAYAGSWEILKDGKLDPSVRVVLQEALLEEWCMVDLEAALHAAIGESMIEVCSPGIEARSEEVWSWIQDSRFGLSTWPILHTWIEIAGEKDPRMLLRRYDELPPDPVLVKRTPPPASSDGQESDDGDPFPGKKGWRDSGFLKEAPRTLRGPDLPFEENFTPRESALLAIVDHAQGESVNASLAGELIAGVAAIHPVGEGGYLRASILRALSSYDAATLENRLRAAENAQLRGLYLDAYTDKFRQVDPPLRAAESASIPEDLRAEVLQRFGPLDEP